MSDETQPSVIVLTASLYPDVGTMEEALASLTLTQGMRRIAIPTSNADEQAWDAILDAILKAEKVVTI